MSYQLNILSVHQQNGCGNGVDAHTSCLEVYGRSQEFVRELPRRVNGTMSKTYTGKSWAEIREEMDNPGVKVKPATKDTRLYCIRNVYSGEEYMDISASRASEIIRTDISNIRKAIGKRLAKRWAVWFSGDEPTGDQILEWIKVRERRKV